VFAWARVWVVGLELVLVVMLGEVRCLELSRLSFRDVRRCTARFGIHVTGELR